MTQDKTRQHTNHKSNRCPHVTLTKTRLFAKGKKTFEMKCHSNLTRFVKRCHQNTSINTELHFLFSLWTLTQRLRSKLRVWHPTRAQSVCGSSRPTSLRLDVYMVLDGSRASSTASPLVVWSSRRAGGQAAVYVSLPRCLFGCLSDAKQAICRRRRGVQPRARAVHWS